MRSLFLALLLSTSAFAETYILPIAGRAGGEWYPRVSVLNPHDTPVTLRVTRGYPLSAARCVSCVDPGAITIAPKMLIRFDPRWVEAGEETTTGAFVIETSAPVQFDAVYFAFIGGGEERQRIDVARGWLPAGEHLATAEWGVDARMNAVLTNPNEFEIEVAVWLEPRAENEIRVRVPARRTVMARLPEHLCGGTPCVFPPEYPPRPNVVHFDSPAEFLGSVSVVGKTWATFRLASD